MAPWPLIFLVQSSALHIVDAQTPTLIRPVAVGEILSTEDIAGDATAVGALVGKQVRRHMPEGALVRPADVRAPLMVTRNAIVRMQFVRGALKISAEGRALSNGAYGDSVRVMSLSSRTTITGVVADEGLVEVP